MRDGDTIVALSSGSLPSGVAVIRVSGPAAGVLLHEMIGRLPPPRRLTLAAVVLDGETIDHGLVAWLPGPHSFTGEDCVELQLHGSPAVVRGVLRIVGARPDFRLAEAGEFTRRAFENGRLNLTEVEGLGDLVAAETEGQRRQALARADGQLSRTIDRWRSDLLEARAEMEAHLDFSDEGDVGAILPERIDRLLDGLEASMRQALGRLEHGRIVREGFRVALAGAPNAGKSSLLNALSQSDLAIVSEEPGTTRDVREVALDLGGQLVILVDMAGLRATESKAEAEGIRRARSEIGRADLVLWLVAPDTSDVPIGEMPPAPVWRVATKADLALAREDRRGEFSVSVVSGEGLGHLLGRMETAAIAGASDGEPALLSRERDRIAVGTAAAAVADSRRELDRLEVAAEALRGASQALSRLTGAIDAEAVLDRLFSSFCIGK
ncbi:MAG: tRNA uridine-5-carboxymethylaminomethyl(34) synthesis GTPase MnmE [Devosia sp.]|nr:tRNA uridine-5-carboxymethylaminomethyl(34) synthesis GTPase MnmE [Devosia sp.]